LGIDSYLDLTDNQSQQEGSTLLFVTVKFICFSTLKQRVAHVKAKIICY